MNRPTVISVCAIAAIIGGVCTAHAQSGGNAAAAIEGMFKTFDRNGDGQLNAAELKGSTLEEHFPAMDANKDGEVSKAEFTTYRATQIQKSIDRPHE